MISDNDELIKSYLESIKEISSILKSLGNRKRLEILIFLLNRPQSYGAIVEKLELKKTAVSNHLSQLLMVRLIEKGDYGIYNISRDGIEFIKAIERAYNTSPTRQTRRFEALQRRSVSNSFLNRFSQ